MGSGKTAVGRRLARLLEYDFHDSDHHLEQQTGVDVAFIFDKEGEAGFRRRERQAIDALTRLDGIVLATGGGAVLDPDNRNHLASRGLVVYLETSIAQQLERTRRGRGRPLLEEGDPGEKLERLMREREPLYREIADVVVSTNARHVNAVAREIRRSLPPD